jgi:hypothetical protein
LSAVLELMSQHDLIEHRVRKQQSAVLISQIEDKLNLTPKFQPE